jgi:NodT family efflux transporter outer membrane factor (OMF) lipoprotein
LGQSVDGAISAEWWRDFGDPVLAGIVEKALANNADIAIAAARVQEARAQFRLVEGQRLPSLGFGAGGGRERFINPFGVPSEQTAGEAKLAISYDLDLFGRLANSSKAAKASLLATKAAQDNVRLAVAASAAGGYIGLRALDARLAVLRDTLAARADSFRLVGRRAKAGYATQLELDQSEAEYRATEQLIPAIQLAIARQEDGLSVLLGENPRAIERGLDLLQLTPPKAPAGLPSALLRRRPDIAQAEQQIVAADHALDAARAAFMPSIQLTADGGYVASTLLRDDPIGIFSIGGSLLAPLYTGERLEAQAGVAASRRDQAAFAYRKAALNAFREVEDSLAAVRWTDEQAHALTLQRDALDRSLTRATKRYRAGYSPYLEVLDAQRGLLSAQLALVQVRADQLNAAVSLYQALGGGWTAAAPEAP